MCSIMGFEKKDVTRERDPPGSAWSYGVFFPEALCTGFSLSPAHWGGTPSGTFLHHSASTGWPSWA